VPALYLILFFDQQLLHPGLDLLLIEHVGFQMASLQPQHPARV
jgi:hypothetical protein